MLCIDSCGVATPNLVTDGWHSSIEQYLFHISILYHHQFQSIEVLASVVMVSWYCCHAVPLSIGRMSRP